jgi:putrescine importer
MTGAPPPKLGTTGLVIFGLVLVQPIAPVPIFGLASRMTHGHATLALLVAMVAMLLTAVSYGHLAAAHPTGGSAYTYASCELHPHAGFLAGWGMGLDYLFIPIISALYAALTLSKIVPHLPFFASLALFIVGLTLVNLVGSRVSHSAHLFLLIAMLVAVGVFGCAAVSFIVSTGGGAALFDSKALFDPDQFDARSLWRGTSLMALAYIGFDGVTTMADEARNPERTVPRATVLVVLITGLLGGLEVYLAHLAWPQFATFPAVETAFLDVALRVGGPIVMTIVSVTLLAAAAGTFLSAQASAARLLLAMGKDGALPRWPFAAYDEKRRVPHLNVILIAVLTTLGAATMQFEQAAELVNFGAIAAFLAVNAAATRRAFRQRNFVRAAFAVAGFAFCLSIGVGLSNRAKAAGAGWLLIGVLYLIRSSMAKTRKMEALRG